MNKEILFSLPDSICPTHGGKNCRRYSFRDMNSDKHDKPYIEPELTDEQKQTDIVELSKIMAPIATEQAKKDCFIKFYGDENEES